MIEITPELWAIEVPNYIAFVSIFIDENNLLDSWNPHYKGGCQLPEGKWKLIGSIDADEMDFYPNRLIIENWDYSQYLNYAREVPINKPLTSEDLFRLWLASKNLHWVNPLGKVEPQITDPDISSQYYSAQLHEAYKWQQAEKAIIKGKLVIIQKM